MKNVVLLPPFLNWQTCINDDDRSFPTYIRFGILEFSLSLQEGETGLVLFDAKPNKPKKEKRKGKEENLTSTFWRFNTKIIALLINYSIVEKQICYCSTRIIK